MEIKVEKIVLHFEDGNSSEIEVKDRVKVTIKRGKKFIEDFRDGFNEFEPNGKDVLLISCEGEFEEEFKRLHESVDVLDLDG